MKRLLPLLLLLGGCTTTSYTETTQTTKPAGAPLVRLYDKPGAGQLLEFRTPREADGFEFTRVELTDTDGEVRVTLLPAALQCLLYRHDVKLSVLAAGQSWMVLTETIDAERARQIVEEWRVQAKLGAKVPLRRAERGLLDRAIAGLADATVVDALKEMIPHIEEVPDWR